MGEEPVADRYAGIEDDMGQDDRVVADGDAVGKDGIGSDVRSLADLDAGSDGGRRVDAGGIRWRLVEQRDGVGERQIGILDPQGGDGEVLETRLDDEGGGAGGERVGGVFGVGDEGDFARAGYLNRGDAGDFDVATAAGQGRAQTFG